MGYDENATDPDPDFAPPDETPAPDWGADDTSAPAGGTSSDDSDFRLPPDIREPDWNS